ncbi:MAG TPA: DUF262 domain-containing protein [Salinivirga sp.]|uniref:DUF262 domain-containing protein n=1 Tax=Salinivirga sp. TaxID=1970192 RepID=UPI002B47747E|nr:DUF262 domain-containing protein [Salinivirga sp.]HKK60057.1 DUF262 domain-containing protein [Salinivirga sp.]
MRDTNIKIVTDWTLPTLLEKLEKGEIKIPRFQRDYTWERPKVVLLLNSIYLQYPIGTFFLWIAPEKYKNFIHTTEDLQIPQNNTDGNTQFILDGQQRILSLYMAMKGLNNNSGNYAQICFNPAAETFRVPRRKNEKYAFPAWKIFDEPAFNEIAEKLKSDSKRIYDSWINVREILMNYPVSVVKTLNYELDEVVEIFERINQGGKRLTSFDLVHATTWSTDFDLKEKIEEVNSIQKIEKAGGLTEKVFTHALALNAFDDCRSSYQLKLNPELAKNLWHKTQNAISRAIDLLHDMRITTGLGAYQIHIIILQYYFFRTDHTSMPEDARKKVEKWFWDARFSKRFSKSTYTTIKDDAQWIIGLAGE